MIARLKGTLISKTSTEVIIDCNGVGYLASISVNTSSALPDPGKICELMTILIPREDSMQLYGFINEEESDAFKMLISVSGIGPKIALGVLSSLSVSDLQNYILTGNINALQKMPGIGKKTAERLHIELKDKITKLEISSKPETDRFSSVIRQEAIAALVTLGYSNLIADKAVRKVLESESEAELTAEKLIRKALKAALTI